jgi:hypothetical protein
MVRLGVSLDAEPKRRRVVIAGDMDTAKRQRVGRRAQIILD